MNSVLDKVGKKIIKEVRDRSTTHMQDVVSGDMQSQVSKEVFEKLSHFSDEDKKSIIYAIRLSIDVTLHNFLWLVEEDQLLDLTYTQDLMSPISISKVSDGLSGELYTEDGWIEKFSKFPPIY